jgi:hypothetical protein
MSEIKKGLRAPRPNVGSCENTGTWPDSSMIGRCKACVSVPGYYGEKNFYCNGRCMSQYESKGGQCSTMSLVAKTEDQCDKPCFQAGAPSLAGCSDDFDCDNGTKCVGGQCKKPEGYELPIKYVINDNFYDERKMYIGVL